MSNYNLHLSIEQFRAAMIAAGIPAPLQTWCSKNYKRMKHKDVAKLREKIAEAKHLYSIEQARKQAIAANKAECIYSNADPAKLNHSYLVQKQIKAFCAHQTGNHIVLLITDFQGKLWSLRYISPNGKKRYWFLCSFSHFLA